jgi:hypothetical protein
MPSPALVGWTVSKWLQERLIDVLDFFIARPLFWVLYYKPKGK